MLLAVGWSATIGGLISTPVGTNTPTPCFFLGIYEDMRTPMDLWNDTFEFGPFMAVAVPISFLLLVTGTNS